jgi:hypothetical protein
MEKHHWVARSRGGTDDDWNFGELSEYEHAYEHALNFVLFENAPAFDFRMQGWKQLPKDLQQAVKREKARRTAEHNQTPFMGEVTRQRNLVDNPVHKPGVKAKIYTEERNKKISEKLTGQEKTQEHRNNLSGSNNGMYGMTGELNPFYGQKHTKETTDKMSIAKKGKPWSAARRKAFEDSKANEH